MHNFLDNPVIYESPDISELWDAGFHPVDMHLHTCHSDGLPKISDLLAYADRKTIGVAITDHNEIRGAIEASSCKDGPLVIPGIELETTEGPHLLCYFYSPGDLEDFFRVFDRERQKKNPDLRENLSVLECLLIAESYECLRIAAHPYGYWGINRGVLKCTEKNLLPGVLSHIDGIEVICGGMMQNLNQKAASYANQHSIPFTGGSDAHILSDVGSVITGVKADSVENFLKGIVRRENIVVGKPAGALAKGATAGVIAWSFVPYTASLISSHYQMQKKSAQKKWTDLPFSKKRRE